MNRNKLKLLFSLIFLTVIGLNTKVVVAQQVENVPLAFASLSSEPVSIFISNELEIPNTGGHLQGVQWVEQEGNPKLLISGSSLTQAYILQVDLNSEKTEKLITLMNQPYRHAGGFQVSEPYLAVGIEDNHTKTTSKVCLYKYHETNLFAAQPNMIIERSGEPKRRTAGSVGLLSIGDSYLMVVSNWDSRNWDFYLVDPANNSSQLLYQFTAPATFPNYQSINFIRDSEMIYAVGFYQEEQVGYGDLIRVSKATEFEPIMEQIITKTFECRDLVDFGAAAGLQVDNKGKLHVWGTQRNTLDQLVINRFSELKTY
jgi:hypothetical protein